MNRFLLILSLLLILLIAGVILRIAGKRKAGSILLFLFFLALLAIGAAILLPEFFTVQRITWTKPFWFAAAFFAAGVFLAAFCLSPRFRFWKKALAALLVCAAVAGGFYGVKEYQKHYDAVETVEVANDLLARYMPWDANTEVAALSEESDLRLTEDLPVLDGATALFPLYSAFAKAVYPKEALDWFAFWNLPDDDFASVLHCATTTVAYQKIITGQADMIFVGAPSAEQRAAAKAAGVELIYTPIGREAFVFFVNAKNPLANLSQETIRKIYGGEITRWRALGVKGLGKIIPFQREEGSGSQSALLRMMDGRPLMKAPQERTISDMRGIVEQTGDYKNFKNALGYSFRFYCMEMVKNDGIKLLQIDGVAPTVENIANGTYPLGESFYAVTRADAGENVQAFLRWITGPQGQALVEKTGYVRQTPAQ